MSHAGKIKSIIADHLGWDVERVTDDSSLFDDLGADSLDQIEMVMEFEQEFGLEITDEDAESLQTVGDVIKYIDKRAEA